MKHLIAPVVICGTLLTSSLSAVCPGGMCPGSQGPVYVYDSSSQSWRPYDDNRGQPDVFYYNQGPNLPMIQNRPMFYSDSQNYSYYQGPYQSEIRMSPDMNRPYWQGPINRPMPLQNQPMFLSDPQGFSYYQGAYQSETRIDQDMNRPFLQDQSLRPMNPQNRPLTPQNYQFYRGPYQSETRIDEDSRSNIQDRANRQEKLNQNLNTPQIQQQQNLNQPNDLNNIPKKEILSTNTNQASSDLKYLKSYSQAKNDPNTIVFESVDQYNAIMKLSDDQLQQKIQAAIDAIDENKDFRNVQVLVSKGIITLRGIIDSNDLRRNLKRHLEEIEEVKSIEDQIYVQQSPTRLLKISDAFDVNSPKQPTITIPQPTTTTIPQQTKTYPTDQPSTTNTSALSNKIQDALRGSYLTKGFENVTFEIKNGNIVILKGFVDAEKDRWTLEEKITNIEGVKDVLNQTKVGNPEDSASY